MIINTEATDDASMAAVGLTARVSHDPETATLFTLLRYISNIAKFYHEHHQCERSLVVMMSALHVI